MTHEPPVPAEREGLLPCPFCGSHPNPDPQNDDCPLPGDYGKDGGRYYQTIWCEKCGAEGGKRETEAEAIAAWNTRPSTPPARPGREDLKRLADLLIMLADKEDGVGMSYEAPSYRGLSGERLNLYGKRAHAAYRLLSDGRAFAEAVERLSRADDVVDSPLNTSDVVYRETASGVTQTARRTLIANIVARAKWGSLHPELGVPDDVPGGVDDQDRRAADAILALFDGASA